MNKSNKLLSDLVAFRTYAKYLPHLSRRELLDETINRNMLMHLERFPKLSRDIIKAFKQVHDMKVMPSMRTLQFAGEAILKNHMRTFNCSYTHIKQPRAFAEIIYLLLCGTGVGYSVQREYISQLPKIKKPKRENKYIIHDSIEGWADAVDMLFNAYFYGAIRPIFNYSQISPKGTYLTTSGSKAPGPEPLKLTLELIEQRLIKAIGRKLSSLEVHDNVCILADCVLSGGIRRAATISLFDKDDTEMLTCKQGEWWIKHPYRARANNSAVLHRKDTTKKEFMEIFNACIESNCGEPGFLWTSDLTMGKNPCFSGDTLIGVADGRGRVSIKTLAEEGKDVPVYSINPSTGLVSIKLGRNPRVTGVNEKLLRIHLDDGTSLDVTPNHKMLLKDGSSILAKDLKSGDSLPRFDSELHAKSTFHSGNYSNISNETLEQEAIKLTQQLNRRFSSDEWNQYAKENNLIIKFSEWRQDGWFKSPTELAKWAAQQLRLEHINEDPRLIKNYQNCLAQGYDCEIINSQLIFTKQCEKCSHSFTTPRREISFCSISCSTNDIARKSSPFRYWDDLKKSAETYNHKVLRIEELPGLHTVYNLTVDDDHTVSIITKYNATTKASSGIYLFNCGEVSLNSFQVCNLTTTNMTGIKSEKDFHNRIYASALLGTLQATYTDFHYLNDNWKIVTENEALLGCSFTGIADSPGLSASQLQNAAKLVLEVNEKYAKKLGINLAARACTIKPEGSASAVLGSSSGIHARHAQFYLRRIRLNKEESLAKYLRLVIPDLVEDDLFSSRDIVVTIPQASPENAILRENESAIQLLNRVNFFNKNWVAFGHRSGADKHNVSCSINYKPNEIKDLSEEMWKTREYYAGISLLPFDGGNYKQTPFEACTEEVFQQYDKLVQDIDLTQVLEVDDNTNMLEQVACSGSACEIK
ncbi:MAG: hypothetical protein KDB74_06625 [Flavobacteriales bacterium]|nr:hypothetical protein [Flavobacteriales bacterium]